MWRRKNRVTKELSPKEVAALVEAGHGSEPEIRRWHADFLQHYPSGRLDKQTFTKYYEKLHCLNDSQCSSDKVFEMIDANQDGSIDFNELIVVIVLMSQMNNLDSRLAFAFDMWDATDDGYIDQTELADVISAIYDHSGVTNRKGNQDPKKRAKEIISKLDISGDQKLSKEEFVTGCRNDPVIRNLLVRYA